MCVYTFVPTSASYHVFVSTWEVFLWLCMSMCVCVCVRMSTVRVATRKGWMLHTCQVTGTDPLWRSDLLSSNDRPALNLCPCSVCHWENKRWNRESQDKFCFYLFIYSHTHSFFCIRWPICMHVCTSLLCPWVCMCVLPIVWWGVYMINTRQAWEEFWSGALQQLLWKQH